MALRPPLENQLALPDGQRSNDCGETAVSMLLMAHGIMDTPIEEISDLNHDGVTNVAELVRLLTDNGAIVTPVAAAALAGALNANQAAYALILIHDNSNADPAVGGTFTHWIDGYAFTGAAGIACANPWGGRDITYSLPQLIPAIEWAAVVTWPPPPPPPVPGGQVMWIAKDIALLPSGTDGYLLDGWGGLHTIGSMPAAQGDPYWLGWNIARKLALNPDGSGGYVMDGWGGLHPFSARAAAPPAFPNPPPVYWPGWDVAVSFVVTDWATHSGYILDGKGGIHPFNAAAPLTSPAYWPNAGPLGQPWG